MLRSLLLGDNAFLGVSHLSQVRARERASQLDSKEIADVIEKAISSGASGFTFSLHPTNLEILKRLRGSGKLDRGFDLYPVLPYAEGYVRIANEKGTAGLIEEVLHRLPLSGKAKLLVRGSVSALKLDPTRMLRAYVDMELDSYLRVKPRLCKLRTVLLHDLVTDLGLAFRAKELFDSFAKHIRENYCVSPGFVTRNFVRFVEFFRDTGLPLRDTVIMTPFNKIGFQMNPSRQSCEGELSRFSEGNVVAMSIMAGGYLALDDAVEYIRALPNLSGIAVGASSQAQAERSFTKLRTLVTP